MKQRRQQGELNYLMKIVYMKRVQMAGEVTGREVTAGRQLYTETMTN